MSNYCMICGRFHELTTAGCQNPPYSRPRTPHKCPVCDGSGKVTRPPWVAGDQPIWTSSGTETYDCNACHGTGIVWSD